MLFPHPLTRLPALSTATQTFEATQALAQHLGKATCVSADRPGFIVNRVLMPMINEAFFALMEVGGWLLFCSE